jgi:hypothetical protein
MLDDLLAAHRVMLHAQWQAHMSATPNHLSGKPEFRGKALAAEQAFQAKLEAFRRALANLGREST